ncbi:MAG: hypothetical protein ABIO40_11830 [Devosia sp.]
MQGLSKHQTLQDLRTRIQALEKRPPGLEENAVAAGKPGLFTLPSGLLHEVFTDLLGNAGAALGFSLGLARELVRPERPAILYLQLLHEAQELGTPYGAGIATFGLDPANLIFCRVETPIELLWAAEEAIGCPAVAAVLVDVGAAFTALDFTASRRFALRCSDTGSSLFLLRYGLGREASAARLRWHVEPVLSGKAPFDARAPTEPRWQVNLEKGTLGLGRAPVDLIVDWTQNGFERVDAGAGADGLQAPAPLSGAAFAALGDRLSEAS